MQTSPRRAALSAAVALFVLATALALLSCAATAPRAAGVRLLSGATTAPLRLERGLMVVPCGVRQRSGELRQLDLMLDIGSAHALSLPRASFDSAAGTPIDARARFRNARGDLLEARRMTLDELSVAAARWTALPSVEAVWHPDYAPPVRSGSVGPGLFIGLRVVVDLPAGALSLAPSSPCEGGHPLRICRHGLYVDLRLEGHGEVTALLDTGATHTLATDSDLAGSSVAWLGGQRIEIGPPQVVDLPGLPAELVLGVPFFAAQRVTLDLGSGCMLVGR